MGARVSSAEAKGQALEEVVHPLAVRVWAKELREDGNLDRGAGCGEGMGMRWGQWG